MRWPKSGRDSVFNLLNRSAAKAEAALDLRTEAVRRAMLEATPAGGDGDRYSDVFRQIYYAESIQGLWYARSNLMAAIAAEKGELQAQKEMAEISKLFVGLLPKSQSYRRPGP